MGGREKRSRGEAKGMDRISVMIRKENGGSGKREGVGAISDSLSFNPLSLSLARCCFSLFVDVFILGTA
jgi:hypothetical protein